MVDQIIGIDLGGTNVRAAIVSAGNISKIHTYAVKSKGTVDEVLEQICDLIGETGVSGIRGIGVGVPGPVDEEKGIVYELINIPAWKKVHLKEHLEEKFRIPVKVQNDANCFALAEYVFGKGKGVRSFIGLIVGTGMAGGIIIDGKLYAGPNAMAGEFGMISYMDSYLEHYSSGQFFNRKYGIGGKEAADRAIKGDKEALAMWAEFSIHLGKAIETILYAYDPQMIVLGGSVSKSFHLYEKGVWKVLENFAFKNSLKAFRLDYSELDNPGILGAAALHLVK